MPCNTQQLGVGIDGLPPGELPAAWSPREPSSGMFPAHPGMTARRILLSHVRNDAQWNRDLDG